ncbi:DUF397 domain-containing protein [Kitasatospora sp. NPDC051170]|uniref:DUF397 domain-containing protein n=1 Tax=Kitasatospora sp. NPDC051170 TaxID=3364056 RepID=UPI0037952CF3
MSRSRRAAPARNSGRECHPDRLRRSRCDAAPDGAWRKSSYSGGNGGDCIEVAPGFPGLVPVRDSKDPQGPALVFSASAWEAFVAAVRSGDLPS